MIYVALHRSLQRSRDFMLAEDGSSICFSLVSVVKSTRQQLKRIQKASEIHKRVDMLHF